MASVELKVNTSYKGTYLVAGSIIDVDSATADRWVKRNIAFIVDGEQRTPQNENPQDDKDDDKKSEGSQPGGKLPAGVESAVGKKNEYEGMKPKELYELCIQSDIEVESKREAAYYVEKLEAAQVKAQ